MGLYDHWPYTNFHELNLTWLLRRMEELSNVVENFVALNTIKYADPIQWNITTQYEANTVVVDPQSGTAYLSSQPVPAGVLLTNTDYWSIIFTLDVISSNKNITLRDDGSNVLATFSSVAGDWLLWNGTLYKVSQAINVNEAYVVGYNLDRYTVEMFIADYVAAIEAKIGDLANLSTTDKSSVVNAINEVVGDYTNLTNIVGSLTDLDTIDKSSIVNAINEVNSRPYINVRSYGAAGDGVTDDYAAFVAAIAAADAGSCIIVPDGTYYISANPDNHTKNIRWLIDVDSTFLGAGARNGLDGVINGFVSPLSNPFNTTLGENSKIYCDKVSKVGGGNCYYSKEIKTGSRMSKIITGTITNGSAVMTNVSDISDIYVGDSIIPTSPITGFPDGSTRANSMRVVSIDADTNSITFGSTPAPNAIAGDGWCIATPWTGTTQSTTFTIRPRDWNVLQYAGVDTGNYDNIDSFSYLYNGVFNVNGGSGNAIELDINLAGAASGEVTGILLTGIGDQNDANYGLVINRGGSVNWTTGIDIGNCLFGIGISAYQPILIRCDFYDNVTQNVIPPYYGILFDNINDMVSVSRPLFGGEQLVDNATCILLARSTDSTPTGAFINCLNKARDTELFKVDVEGEVTTPMIKVAQNFTAETVTCNYTFTVKDVNGSILKVPCYFGP